MLNLYKIETKRNVGLETLLPGEKFSVFYHNLFDFPMNFADLVRWSIEQRFAKDIPTPEIVSKNGYYFINGNETSVYKRVLKKRISEKKMKVAKNAADILAALPGIKMVAVTGSLAMYNSADESDIDLMIVTKKGNLWTTRALAYAAIRIFGLSTRKPNDLNQKDKLCLNIWLDESDLVWKERNLYTAHEIAQIIPLVNKNQTYERFLSKNKWILGYWPNAVRISEERRVKSEKTFHFSFLAFTFSFIEKLTFLIQHKYMKSKITREVVTPTRALFHPQDWGKVVLERLSTETT